MFPSTTRRAAVEPINQDRLMTLCSKDRAEAHLLMTMTVESVGDFLETMGLALNGGDLSTFASTLHDLYGIASGVGADEVACLARDLQERFLEDCDAAYLGAGLTDLREAQGRLNSATVQLAR